MQLKKPILYNVIARVDPKLQYYLVINTNKSDINSVFFR